jgi:hypothetical protein
MHLRKSYHVIKNLIGHYKFKSSVILSRSYQILELFYQYILDVPQEETTSEKKCFINAECIFGELLNYKVSDSQTNCLNHCQKIENCKWFTYNPTIGKCLTYSECIEFHPTSQCPDCVSGEPDCINCWMQNSRCYGTFIDKVKQKCIHICKFIMKFASKYV